MIRGANVTDEQLAQAETLEGATLPDGTRHTRQEPQPEPKETEADNAEGQPDQLGEPDAGDNDKEVD